MTGLAPFAISTALISSNLATHFFSIPLPLDLQSQLISCSPRHVSWVLCEWHDSFYNISNEDVADSLANLVSEKEAGGDLEGPSIA